MSAGALRFDAALEAVRSDELRRMARLWGAGGLTRKAELVVAIRKALDDPAKVRQAVAGLTPLERAALAITKQHGGIIGVQQLIASLRAAGYSLESKQAPLVSDGMFARELVHSGLFLSTYLDEPTYVNDYGGAAIFSDERLLAQLGPPEYVPLDLQGVAAPPESRLRRPSSVMLDLLALFQTLDGQAGLQLTRAGTVRVADLRRLAKSLRWDDNEARFDGMLFRQPVLGLTDALLSSGILIPSNDRVQIVDIDRLTQLPTSVLVSLLLIGFRHLRSWAEIETDYWHDAAAGPYNQVRSALLAALAALPQRPSVFVPVSAFSAALFERIGRHHSLAGFVPAFYFGRRHGADTQHAQEHRDAALRRSWQEQEEPWIHYALASWLYYLGMVELGVTDGRIESFRLTDLGLQVLHQEPGLASAPAASGPAWLIQPDFEVVVFLEQAAPAQISLIERAATRTQAEAHVARYRLTRDSVYQALERGLELESLLDGLAAGSGSPLPQNVVVTIRDWGAQRDRITLHRRAQLLEFPTPTARDLALSDGISGTPVGDRFVLLGTAAVRLPAHTPIDYSRPLPHCLKITEDGKVTLTRPTGDLLVRPLLKRWAEPLAENAWQLTAASVGAAVKGGGTLSMLLSQLDERLTHRLPPLLGFALRAWAGRPPAAMLGEVTLLQFEDPELARAVADSKRFQPFLRAALGPQALLVESEALPLLREQLDWLGVSAAPASHPAQLVEEAPPPPERRVGRRKKPVG